MSDHDVIHEAASRSWNNRHSATNVPLTSDAETLGVLGEKCFCDAIGLDWQTERPTERHDGYQFVINGRKVKTYTASRPGYSLLVKQGRVTADIYVLCYHNNGKVWIAGWANKSMVRNAPVEVPKKDGGYLLASHKLPLGLLQQDVQALRKTLGMGTNGQLALEAS